MQLPVTSMGCLQCHVTCCPHLQALLRAQPLLLSRRAPLPAAALLPALPAAAAPSAFSLPLLAGPAASLTVRVTVDTPSTNLVLKMTLALLNMPSFRDTTMNWLCLGAGEGREAAQAHVRGGVDAAALGKQVKQQWEPVAACLARQHQFHSSFRLAHSPPVSRKKLMLGDGRHHSTPHL